MIKPIARHGPRFVLWLECDLNCAWCLRFRRGYWVACFGLIGITLLYGKTRDAYLDTMNRITNELQAKRLQERQ